MSRQRFLRSIASSESVKEKFAALDPATETALDFSFIEILDQGRFTEAIVKHGEQKLSNGRKIYWYIINTGIALIALLELETRDIMICADFAVIASPEEIFRPPAATPH
jgi:hypothetical protein